jgi:hypothetical protein
LLLDHLEVRDSRGNDELEECWEKGLMEDIEEEDLEDACDDERCRVVLDEEKEYIGSRS